MLPGDEVIKVIITAYVFAHFEVACYTALLTAAKRVGDHSAMHTLEGILAEERGMADSAAPLSASADRAISYGYRYAGVEAGHCRRRTLWSNGKPSRSSPPRNRFRWY